MLHTVTFILLLHPSLQERADIRVNVLWREHCQVCPVRDDEVQGSLLVLRHVVHQEPDVFLDLLWIAAAQCGCVLKPPLALGQLLERERQQLLHGKNNTLNSGHSSDKMRFGKPQPAEAC